MDLLPRDMIYIRSFMTVLCIGIWRVGFKKISKNKNISKDKIRLFYSTLFSFFLLGTLIIIIPLDLPSWNLK